MPSRKVVTGDTIVVDGLRELQAGLASLDPTLRKDLNSKLKKAGQIIAEQAARNVSHKTARHGNPGPPLEQTIKVSSTSTGVSLYSNAPHAGVQDQGGQVGRGHATLLKRSEVSHYMSDAVTQKMPDVEATIMEAVDEASTVLEG